MADMKTVYKLFFVWDFEKEERWLNEMAMDGWALKDVGICRYSFERTEPGEYTVRLEMRRADDEYMGLLEESGAEFVGRYLQWHYFRKRTSLGAFDLLSDIDSRVDHLTRIGKMVMGFGLANLGLGVVNSLINGSGVGVLNLLVATMLMYGLGRITGKREEMEKERQIRE